MALCACKCLNVKLESDKVEAITDIGKLELTTTEQRDIYFSEKLFSCASNEIKIQVVQPALIGQRFVGNWTVHSCLSCGQTTHAILQDKHRPNICLFNKSLQTTHDHINNLKKANNYSPVFNLLLPEVSSDIEMKENVDTSNLIISEKKWPRSHQVIGTLSKHMSQTLQSQLEAMEETVRQFRDQKYAEFEASDNASWNANGAQSGPPSPQLPPLQRRRLSSIKDAKKLTHNFVKNNRSLQQEEDSLDTEDLFDLEARPRGGGGHADIARSLPMNIARFPNDRSNVRELDEDDYEEPQDIAASIKALARSVHGDVFELPRPRFSTQI
ncbi:Lobe protein [Operophtera brumata]|uniref:Lobe protein n=1 Tax=Operophtera brumata TaxID=104452 RepID=A0A0L7LVL5_OPEBR|nr:Lobe protein [Operophtera brumata]